MTSDNLFAEEFFSFLTGKASTAMSRRLQRNLKESCVTITSEQWSLLYYLWNEEGLTQQELANLTFRDKPSISRLINNLEKLKLVIRVNDKGDRRTNLIYLTKEGRKIKTDCMAQASRTITEALDNVDRDKLKDAQHILETVYQNLR
ncbi:MarR family transcriptional regulator [Sphingobacterium alkalisoli]|uniref:MarR family transcriptional regulator n=1 Tax=Sphingobacterium alkalisoli TaxID=1874115 RepID=A0A4U0GYK4_9SPHI|nr:MarR family transcriptional regulator [Sphingobacterium alkalisoli]TJY64243.1 MarR family transcriptional regulator [Sphingobacterium alkalisoli]GGH22954.1 MarR family transcriptional regulator [Sphingobacterium alkalisoli]